MIPSVAYVPPEGLILFGDDAQLEGMRDPQGLVHDLKRQIHRSGDVLSKRQEDELLNFGGGVLAADLRRLPASVVSRRVDLRLRADRAVGF